MFITKSTFTMIIHHTKSKCINTWICSSYNQENFFSIIVFLLIFSYSQNIQYDINILDRFLVLLTVLQHSVLLMYILFSRSMYIYSYYIPKQKIIFIKSAKKSLTPRSHNCVNWLHGVSTGLKNCVSLRGHVARIPLDNKHMKSNFSFPFWLTRIEHLQYNLD